eukprot:jgi/Orpsp1_1/1178395/evm.model.c7180000065109.1
MKSSYDLCILIKNDNLQEIEAHFRRKEISNSILNGTLSIGNWYSTPINEAIKNNKFEIADVLLKNEADINLIRSNILNENELYGYRMYYKFDDKINKDNLKYLLEHQYKIYDTFDTNNKFHEYKKYLNNNLNSINLKQNKDNIILNNIETKLLNFFNTVEVFLGDIVLTKNVNDCV